MPGIFQANNITIENITAIGNVTNPVDFFINVNQIVFGGWLMFTLLGILGIIIFSASQSRRDELLPNLITAGAVCTVISLVLRAMSATIHGIKYAMLTDWQMWLFPLFTIFLVFIGYINKQQ